MERKPMVQLAATSAIILATVAFLPTKQLKPEPCNIKPCCQKENKCNKKTTNSTSTENVFYGPLNRFIFITQ